MILYRKACRALPLTQNGNKISVASLLIGHTCTVKQSSQEISTGPCKFFRRNFLCWATFSVVPSVWTEYLGRFVNTWPIYTLKKTYASFQTNKR